jgi:NAD(P)H dehydrogenase (quinone)
MKISVVYFSKSGNTKTMAEKIVEGIQSVEGMEVKVFSLDEIDEQFVKDSRCIILGTPTYIGTMTGAVKNWLEGQALKLGLAGKIGGAFATADYVHGGGDIAVRDILGHFTVFGMLVYSGGGSFGKPVIHYGPVALKDKLSESNETFRLYGQRMASKTKEIFGEGIADS